MNLFDVLSTPYVFEIESIPNEQGEWVCYAAYSELPDCYVIERKPLQAVDKLEEKRLLTIFNMVEQGQPIPIPRRSFKDRYFALTPEPVESILKRIGKAHYLEQLTREVKVIYLNRKDGDK